MRDAGEFLPRHRMPAKEERPFVRRENFLRGLRDAHLRAAGIGDKRVRRSVARNLGKKINRRGNGQSDVDEVSALQRSGKFPVERRINGASCVRFSDNVGAVPAGNTNARGVFSKRQPERPSDQTGTENRDPRDDVA